MNNITISKFDKESTLDLIEEFKSGYLKLLNDPENIKYLSFSGIHFSEEQVHEWLSSIVSKHIEYHLVWHDDHIIAVAAVQKNREFNYEIIALVVDKKYRHNKVGSRLLDFTEQDAIDCGFKAIRFGVFCDNQPMLITAIKRGYKPVRMEYHTRYDGEDMLWFKKYLI